MGRMTATTPAAYFEVKGIISIIALSVLSMGYAVRMQCVQA
jgi:hypothetical protein